MRDGDGYQYRIEVSYPPSEDGKYLFYFEGKAKYSPYPDDLMFYSDVQLTNTEILEKLKGNIVLSVKGDFLIEAVSNDGYYIPTMEEFHKGFEYERVEMFSTDGGPRQLQYVQKVYKGSEHYYVEGSIEYKKIRVKYLDKEDIESLGWKHIQHNEYELGEATLYKFHDKTLTVSVRKNGMLDREVVGLIVKNKSELKKLMSQLSIE